MPENPYEPPKVEPEPSAKHKIARGCFAPLNFRNPLWLLAVCAGLFYWWVDRSIYVGYYTYLKDYVDSLPPSVKNP